MTMTTNNPNAPTRRSAMRLGLAAGLAALIAPAAAGAATGADAELISACANLMACGDRIGWFNRPDAPTLTDEECNAQLERFYAGLSEIGPMVPTTPEGWRAKIIVAATTLASTAMVYGDDLDQQEEQFALDTLRQLVGMDVT